MSHGSQPSAGQVTVSTAVSSCGSLTAPGAEIVIVLNKSDLCPDAADAVERMKEVVDVPMFISSAISGEGLDAILSALGPRTGSLVGISGVGKSTLINALLGEG